MHCNSALRFNLNETNEWKHMINERPVSVSIGNRDVAGAIEKGLC